MFFIFMFHVKTCSQGTKIEWCDSLGSIFTYSDDCSNIIEQEQPNLFRRNTNSYTDEALEIRFQHISKFNILQKPPPSLQHSIHYDSPV